MSARPCGLAVLFHRFGPYHLARLEAAGARADLTAIELCAVDRTYAWSRCPGRRTSRASRCFATRTSIRRTDVGRAVRAALAAADPDVARDPGVVAPRGARGAALVSAQTAPRGADVRKHDCATSRRRAREAIKRLVVRLFGSALVGGIPHREYACALGLAPGAVFDGYDVVDNDHFARGARQARIGRERWRARLGLPARFFLASARFVAKKNLLRLLEAYAGYRRRAGADAWHLVLLGDGELRGEIERRIAGADLAGAVVLPGFRQYDELPACYGLARRLRPRQHHRAVGPRGQRGDGGGPAGARLRALRLRA